MTISPPSPLTLYGRHECHLCEHACALLQSLNIEPNFCDIDSDAELGARYGLRIPVLADAHGRELDWPFDAAKVLALGAR